MTAYIKAELGKCKRCKGRRTITSEEDPQSLMSCPDCEGTGEDFDAPDEGEPLDIHASPLKENP